MNNKQGHTKQQVQQALIIKKQESYNTQTKQTDDPLVYERLSQFKTLTYLPTTYSLLLVLYSKYN
jgi:hypothetical protein